MINHQHFKNYWIKLTLLRKTFLRALATRIHKILHGYSPAILNEVFVPSHCKYNFRKNDTIERRRVNTVRCGTESL